MAPSGLRPARVGVVVIFFVYGAVLATWVSRIPLLKRELGLDTAELSVALLGSPVGLIVATQIVTPVIRHSSSAAVTRSGAVAACACVVLPSLAWNLPSLTLALFLLGMSLGALDTAMNTQGVAIERGYARPIMSGIHGMYSVGVLVGAAAGALAAAAGVDPTVHFAVAGALLAAVSVVGGRSLLGAEADAVAEAEQDTGPVHERLLGHPSLVALGVVAFCCLFAEGAVDDWSGVYLHEEQGASLGIAPLAAAACGIGMATGRFVADGIIARLGRPATLTRAALLATAGMTIAVLAPVPGVAIAGYLVLGLGVAAIVPIAFTLAGNTQGVPPAWAISRVTMIGYAGLFSGPPLIGLVAQLTGLGAALTIPAVLLLLVAVLGGLVARATAPARS
jgi:fucose permease